MGRTVNNFYLRRVRGERAGGTGWRIYDFRPPPPNVNLPGLGFWRGGVDPHREKLRRGQNCCLHFLNVPHAYTPRKGWWLYKDLLNSSHILWVPSESLCLPHVLKKAAVAQLSPLKDCCVTSLWWLSDINILNNQLLAPARHLALCGQSGRKILWNRKRSVDEFWTYN